MKSIERRLQIIEVKKGQSKSPDLVKILRSAVERTRTGELKSYTPEEATERGREMRKLLGERCHARV